MKEHSATRSTDDQTWPDQTFGQISGHYITLHLNYLPFLARVPWLWLCAVLLSLSLSLSLPCFMCALTIVGILEKNVQLHTYICAKKLRMAHTQALGTGTSTHTFANRHPVCTIPIGNTFKELFLYFQQWQCDLHYFFTQTHFPTFFDNRISFRARIIKVKNKNYLSSLARLAFDNYIERCGCKTQTTKY